MALNEEEKSILLTRLERLYMLQNYFNAYAYKNMLLIGKAENALIVTYINPNLYSIAVQYYGDEDFWTVIGKANHLSDPCPIGTYTLLIPPKPSVSSGAVMSYPA